MSTSSTPSNAIKVTMTTNTTPSMPHNNNENHASTTPSVAHNNDGNHASTALSMAENNDENHASTTPTMPQNNDGNHASPPTFMRRLMVDNNGDHDALPRHNGMHAMQQQNSELDELFNTFHAMQFGSTNDVPSQNFVNAPNDYRIVSPFHAANERSVIQDHQPSQQHLTSDTWSGSYGTVFPNDNVVDSSSLPLFGFGQSSSFLHNPSILPWRRLQILNDEIYRRLRYCNNENCIEPNSRLYYDSNFSPWENSHPREMLQQKVRDSVQTLQQMNNRRLDKVTDDFDRTFGRVADLIVQFSGSNRIQQLLSVCDDELRLRIIHALMEPNIRQFIRVSLNVYGSKVVRKLIRVLKTSTEIELVTSAIMLGVVDLMKDQENGNPVIECCLNCLPPNDTKKIVEAIARNCVEIATNKHGCTAMNKCIEKVTGDNKRLLVAAIASYGYIFSKNAYANYVVQTVIQTKDPVATATLMSEFEGNYVFLSTHHFASHVIEQCLKNFNYKNKERIVRELLSVPHFEQILNDQYANFVINIALKTIEGNVYTDLVHAIRPHLPQMRTSPFGKGIYNTLIRS